jgi:hypothetical protein
VIVMTAWIDDKAISAAKMLDSPEGRSKLFAERMEASNAFTKRLVRQTAKRQSMAAYHERGRVLARKRHKTKRRAKREWLAAA